MDTDGLITLRDFFRYAVSRFNAARLAYGHGTNNAIDEAAFLILEALKLPIENVDPWLDARLTLAERERILSLIEARIATRKPAAYLVGRAYIQGIPFIVDERVIVPRSYIAELLLAGTLGETGFGLIGNEGAIGSVLDLCTGGGSLAIIAANVFPNAVVDAVDLSGDALEVAKLNVEEHELGDRIHLMEGDLFGPLSGRRYDLIITNPPYVAAPEVKAFPPEYACEPQVAHLGGSDGLDLVRRILSGAGSHLTADGALLCEVGTGREKLESEYDLPFTWLDTEESEGEVFWLPSSALAPHV